LRCAEVARVRAEQIAGVSQRKGCLLSGLCLDELMVGIAGGNARVGVIVLRPVAIGLWGQRKQWAITGAICEHPIIPGQVLVWGWEQDGEAFEELQGLQDELGDSGGSGPGSGELVSDLWAREHGEPPLGKRRAQAVATEPFESFAVLLLHSTCGV